MQKMFKNEQIRLFKHESNEPIFKKQLTLLVEKDKRAVNESPHEEDHAEVDPADAKL